MSASPESPYRALRRAFIAAAQDAGLDAIARVHPGRGPDGKPLFQDAVALGPRNAAKAVLAVAAAAAGSRAMTGALQTGARPPRGARLVLVHAFDPHAFAWGAPGIADWPGTSLCAVATEDLAKVASLTVLGLDGPLDVAPLRLALPGARIRLRVAGADINAALAAL